MTYLQMVENLVISRIPHDAVVVDADGHELAPETFTVTPPDETYPGGRVVIAPAE